MAIFGKKEEKKGRGVIPVDRVKDLSSKGFSEPEIIDILRREGYSPEEIDKAFTELIKTAVTKEERPAPKPTETPKETTGIPEIESLLGGETKVKTELTVPETSLPSTAPATEEYFEYMLDERLVEVYQRFEDIYYRIEELEKSINEINEKISSLTKAKIEESEELSKKVETFTESLQSITGRVGSLEKAFKETLPSLVEAIKSLNESLKKVQ